MYLVLLLWENIITKHISRRFQTWITYLSWKGEYDTPNILVYKLLQEISLAARWLRVIITQPNATTAAISIFTLPADGSIKTIIVSLENTLYKCMC